MKSALFGATALLLTGAAFAQPGNTVSDPSQSTGSRGVTQQGTDPEGQPCTPAGFNAGTTGYAPCGAGNAPAEASAAPPACSRTVTDHCVQNYERGVRRR